MVKHRERISSGHNNIGKYVFRERYISAEEYQVKAAISSLAQKENREGLTRAEKQELGVLRDRFLELVAEHRTKMKSVLTDSKTEHGAGSGKDNLVFTSSPKSGLVYKYSVPKFAATPEAVEYLQKKYLILQKYMHNWIPKSYFVLGERDDKYGTAIDEPGKRSRKIRAVVITIQRKVHGRNFQEMTAAEKEDEMVVSQLFAAHAQYIALKKRVRAACIQLNLPEDTLDVKLDIGNLSSETSLDEIDLSKLKAFDSPNIMFDTKKRRLQFIDFDMNYWNEQKEKVFRLLMQQEE